MPLDILDVIKFGGERVEDVNNEDLPIGLAFVKEGHDPKNLDLFDLANVTDLLADFTNIQRVVITFSLRFRVGLLRVFPCLSRGCECQKRLMTACRA